MLVVEMNSTATLARMMRTTKTLETWQIEDADRLKALFADRKGKISQEEFGNRFEIGSQGMVWQYLNARRALNLKAAAGFARGLGVDVAAFSPRLADEMRSISKTLNLTSLKTNESPTDQVTPVPEPFLPAYERVIEALQGRDILELVDKLGIDAAGLDRVLVQTAIPLEIAVKLQELTGYSAIWIAVGKGAKKAQIASNDDWNPIPIPQNSYKKIPVVAMAQLGDNGHFCELEYPVGHGDGYLHFVSTDPNAYGLRCVGDSMEPRIKDGEFVVVEPSHPVTAGDEVLVKSKDGRVMIKILGYTRDGYTHLLSVNQSHKTIKIPVEEIDQMDFVAAIVKASAWRPD